MKGAGVELKNIGKIYGKHWVFRNLELQLSAGERLAITGSNGSGKSTLLRIVSAYTQVSEGSVLFRINGNTCGKEDWAEHIAIAAPYLDLPENLSLSELISFHHQFKKLDPKLLLDPESFCQLPGAGSKRIADFSSGMKQRVRLALALGGKSEMVLLDEPLSNLDQSGIDWFHLLIQQQLNGRSMIIFSNHVQQELRNCERSVELDAYRHSVSAPKDSLKN